MSALHARPSTPLSPRKHRGYRPVVRRARWGRSHYNYFRDYDSLTGRYVESDPIGLGGGINTYAYTKDNPVNYIDFFGLKGCGSGLTEPFTPNNPFGFKFGGCCDSHDDCYGDCANKPTKQHCDSSFLNCTFKKCRGYSGTVMAICLSVAGTYAGAVMDTKEAQSAFDNSRKDCPACGANPKRK